MKEKIRNGILGVCIGDALGVPVEFNPRTSLKKTPIKNMVGYGTHHQPLGTWSDDSSLTLCTIDSLINGYDIEDIAKKFVTWLNNANWTAHGVVFDKGITTVRAIQRITSGQPQPTGGTQINDNGNGSLMRILPLAFFLLNKPLNERIQIINAVSAITHNHAISQMACLFYIEMAIHILNGKTPLTAYQDTCITIKDLDPDPVFNRLLTGKIHTLPENEIESGGFVMHSLEASIWCLLKETDFASTVLRAVNLGGDTDTTGAITGGLAGIYYDEIPKKWVTQLARKDDILNLCDRFSNSI